MNSFLVPTPEGEQFADLSFSRLTEGQYAARLMLGRKSFLFLGTVHGRAGEDWTAVGGKSAAELGLPDRSLTLVEGFRTRYDAAHYLLKINGVVKHREVP